jgi:hypothetical protein
MKYVCQKCDFYSNNKTDYERHNQTIKHSQCADTTNTTVYTQKNARPFSCECGKDYPYRGSLHNHRKKCSISKLNESKTDADYKDIIIKLIEQNKSLQNTISDMVPRIGNVTNNNNMMQNVNNVKVKQNFNMIVFLNENCKDAISMGEFVKTIDVSVKDLLFTKCKGIIEGISNIIVEHIHKIPLLRRPLWCTDKKRKRLFIKNEEWVEDIDNIKTKNIIKQVSCIQVKNINKFTTENPNWLKNEQDKDTYIDIVRQSTLPIDENADKIINTFIHKIHFTDETKNALTQIEPDYTDQSEKYD